MATLVGLSPSALRITAGPLQLDPAAALLILGLTLLLCLGTRESSIFNMGEGEGCCCCWGGAVMLQSLVETRWRRGGGSRHLPLPADPSLHPCPHLPLPAPQSSPPSTWPPSYLCSAPASPRRRPPTWRPSRPMALRGCSKERRSSSSASSVSLSSEPGTTRRGSAASALLRKPPDLLPSPLLHTQASTTWQTPPRRPKTPPATCPLA